MACNKLTELVLPEQPQQRKVERNPESAFEAQERGFKCGEDRTRLTVQERS
jgi:hypothetical protein